jgi:ATP-dependent DNA helicase RecG
MDAQALMEHDHPAWTRMKFDELLAQQLSLAAARAARQSKQAQSYQSKSDQGLVSKLKSALPFTLPAAQQRVSEESAADLGRSFPMYRLLQGDVGSGKTVVAALAALQAIEHGAQVALMAPTEILAEQQYVKLKSWCEPLGIQVSWLILTKSSPRTTREGLPAHHHGRKLLVMLVPPRILSGVSKAAMQVNTIVATTMVGVPCCSRLSRTTLVCMCGTDVVRTLFYWQSG